MKPQEGRVAIVTGAAGGIGLAIVDQLLADGATVLAWDPEATKLAGHPEAATGRLLPRSVDVTDSAAVERELVRADAMEGGLAILVNNAGIAGATRPASEYQRSEWDRVIALNLTSVFEICRRAAPAMAARGYGRVVNISSVGGLRGIADAAAYSASKAGLIGLTQSLAKEYIRSGITFNCVAPALIETPLLAQMTPQFAEAMRSRIPMGRAGAPQEVAAMVGWIASPACSFTTGAVFDVSGGRLSQ
ncbi:SDR family oxidoreductase [Ramlibacter sp. G-1-2-2]|uniref:SDR family oxidoreductase n=1 Tax=Ramlibacter agri TaxID=2728837 RepID=A0A848HAB4_9BURK|nr:SDR family NAD(P)-dependent oxidoreductase [Ramlibacter agri]NML46400.1 SDR family oxidoreductase [Ramlibacter agri]